MIIGVGVLIVVRTLARTDPWVAPPSGVVFYSVVDCLRQSYPRKIGGVYSDLYWDLRVFPDYDQYER